MSKCKGCKWNYNGTCMNKCFERPQGDIISREALKNEMDRPFWEKWEWEFICKSIDNAPSVEITETEVQEVLNKRCMTAITNEYLIDLITLQGKKTQGKWRVYEGVITCEKCGKETEEKTPFCAWCGADMRGAE